MPIRQLKSDEKLDTAPTVRELPPHVELDAAPLDQGVFGGVTNTAARWATLGLNEPASAAARALYEKATGAPESWLDLYHRNLTAQRVRDATFATEHPVANTLAAGAGAASFGAPNILAGAPSLGTEGTSLLGRMARGGITGAAIGGLTGAANSNGQDVNDILHDAWRSAAAGAALGTGLPVAASMLSPVGSAIARRILPGSVDRQAAVMVGNRLAQDVGSGEVGAQRLTNEITGIPQGGAPLALADVGGPNTLALTGKLSRAPGESQTIIRDFLENRRAATGQRLIDYINNDLADQNAIKTADALTAKQRTDAAPLYQKAYNTAPLNPDTIAEGGALDKFMSRPSMKSAAVRALNIAREEGRDPMSLGITFNEAGDPIFEKVPSWQTLDYVKRGLDDELDQYRDAFGRLNLQGQESGRAVDNTRKQFIQFLNDNNPALADARAAYAGPAQSKNAMAMGADFRSMQPEEIEKTLAGMTPSEQQFFRIGAADALRRGVIKTGNPNVIVGPNASLRRGATLPTDQLRAVFPGADDATLKALTENRAENTAYDVLGNSATARRVAEDTSGSHPLTAITAPLSDLALSVGAMKTGEPVAALGLLSRAWSRLNNPLESASNPEVNAAAARLLTNPDLQQAVNALTAPTTTGTRLLLGPTAESAGLAYPYYGLVSNQLMPGETRR